VPKRWRRSGHASSLRADTWGTGQGDEDALGAFWENSPGLFFKFITFCEPFSGCLSLPWSLPGEVWGVWCVFFVITLIWTSSLWFDVWFHFILDLWDCSSQFLCHFPSISGMGHCFRRLIVVLSSIPWHGHLALRVMWHVDPLIASRPLLHLFQPILKRFDLTSR